MKVEKFQLKNGMKVLFQESHKSPVVSIQVWVRTGSADEAKGEEGISHFIEHLVFKGTKSFKVGEIASMIEGSGGELNAYTSFDQTVFYVTISKNFIDIGLKALSEMMGFPLFDATEVDNEREVVIEEIKRGQDSLGRVASQLLFSTAYKKHAYGLPVIGYEENVRKWSAKKIKKYFDERYSPHNMFLVVTGDFNSKEMKKKVTESFEIFKKTKLKIKLRKKEPTQKKALVKVETSKFEQSIAYMAWRVPSVKHKDIAALDVLSMIMGQGDSSKLVHKLRIEQALVNSVGSSLFSTKDQGLYVISMSYTAQNFKAAIDDLKGVIMDIMRGEITEDEIKKAITNIESDNYYGIETVDGLSRKIGDAEFVMNDPLHFHKYIKQIKAVALLDVIKVARKYLVPDKMILTAIENKKADQINKDLHDWKGQYKKEFQALPKISVKKSKTKTTVKAAVKKTIISDKLQVHTLENGVKVIFKQSEGGVISAKSTFLGGTRLEPQALEGVAELAGRAWTGGSKNYTEQEVYRITESMAAGIGATVGKNSFGLSLDALKDFEAESRKVFLDVLAFPKFPSQVLEREKTIQKEQIKTKNDNPAQIASRAFMEAMFNGHPYSRDQLGSIESLDKITQDDVFKYWNSMKMAKNLTFCIAGPADTKAWLAEIKEVTKDFPVGKKVSMQFDFKRPQQKIIKYKSSQKEQSHLIVGFPGLEITSKDRFTLQVIQSILAGQGGRLFIELRDKNSLAYSVSPMRMEGIDAGYFGAYIGCSPDKVKKAEEMLNIEFQKLCNTNVPMEELERAQKYLVGRHDIDLQRVSAISSSILYDDIYGIAPEETFHLKEKYFAITPADIRRVSQAIFAQQPVISLVGPKNPL